MGAEPQDLSGSRALAIIPCLNEANRLEDLIAGILDDPEWVDPLLVVVDGGSSDDSVTKASAIAARDPRVRLAHNPRRLQSAAVNLAVARFGENRQWLVRIDAHCGYPGAYVSTLVDEANRTGAVSVVVSMESRGTTPFQRGAAHAQNSWLGAGGASHRRASKAGWVDHGHHALMDIGGFTAAGGYDETFSHNEDAELDIRLRRQGRIWLTDRARLRYFPRATPETLFHQYVNYGAGRARTFRRHHERPKLRQLAPLFVLPALLLIAGAPLSPLMAAPALAWTLACCALGMSLAAARRDPAALLAGPAAMIMHAGWSLGFWRETFRLPRKRPGPAQESSSRGASLGLVGEHGRRARG